MFSKLLKHEWKANAGLLGILSLCALGAGLLGGLVLKGIIYMAELAEKENVAALGITGLSSLLVFIVVALVAYVLAVQFINLFRFYKNKFTDEGYLTFTLPVKTSHIFLSSYLVNLAWMVISVLVLIVAVGLIVVLGLGENIKEFLDASGDTVGDLENFYASEPGYDLYNALNWVQMLFSPLYSLMLMMTSITLGSVLAKKHKILATIGMYYCITTVIGIVESILGVVPTILLAYSNDNYYYYYCISLGIGLVIQLAALIGGYFLSVGLMKKKLNLP